MCKKKDEEALAVKEKLARLTKECEVEKAAHVKTQSLLQQKIEKIRNMGKQGQEKWNSSPKVVDRQQKHQAGSFSIPGEEGF